MKYDCKRCGEPCYELAKFCNGQKHFACPWYVYIVECNDKGKTLYTGITNNTNKRVAAHNAGRGAKYTRGRLPVKLLKSFEVSGKSAALKMEYKIKQLSRAEKLNYNGETQKDEEKEKQS